MTTSNSTLVSVVMPAYNADSYIVESIQSVLNQTYHNFELLVVDNCSSDHTVDFVRKLQKKDDRIRVLTCLNSGASFARNTGISNALGRYVAFIDCDDIWDEEKLSAQISFMKEYGATISCTHYQPFTDCPNTGKNYKSIRKCPESFGYGELLKTCSVGCSTVIYDRDILTNVRFDDVGKEDYALWLKITKDGVRFFSLSRALTKYRIHSSSLSSNKFKEIKRQWYIYRHIEAILV